MKSLILAFSLLLILPNAFAGNAKDLLARDFRAAKIPFNKEVRLFNYFTTRAEHSPEAQAKLNDPQSRQQLIRERIYYFTNNFWISETRTNGFLTGEGFYLAIDPIVSKDYGNMMIELKVKPTSTYISLTRGVIIAKDTVNAIYKEGYKTLYAGDEMPDSMRFSDMTLRTMFQPENRKFRNLILSVFKQENINFMEYTWKSELPLICGENSSSSAFIYIGNQEILSDFSSVTLVDTKNLHSLQNLSKNEKLTKENTQQLYDFMNQQSDLYYQTNEQQSSLPTNKNSQVLESMKESLFGCEL